MGSVEADVPQVNRTVGSLVRKTTGENLVIKLASVRHIMMDAISIQASACARPASMHQNAENSVLQIDMVPTVPKSAPALETASNVTALLDIAYAREVSMVTRVKKNVRLGILVTPAWNLANVRTTQAVILRLGVALVNRVGEESAVTKTAIMDILGESARKPASARKEIHVIMSLDSVNVQLVTRP